MFYIRYLEYQKSPEPQCSFNLTIMQVITSPSKDFNYYHLNEAKKEKKKKKNPRVQMLKLPISQKIKESKAINY